MELPVRKANRLPEDDDASPGAYFIMICTRDRQCLLSRVGPCGFGRRRRAEAAREPQPGPEHLAEVLSRACDPQRERLPGDSEYIDANPARWAEDRYYER